MREGVAYVLQVSVGKSAQRGINIPRIVSRCFWSSCFWRIRRPRRRSRGTHQAMTGPVTEVGFCSASSCRGRILTACLSKHRVLNRRPGGGISWHQENTLKKHDNCLTCSFWLNSVWFTLKAYLRGGWNLRTFPGNLLQPLFVIAECTFTVNLYFFLWSVQTQCTQAFRSCGVLGGHKARIFIW